jgi:hypothetical protein
MIISISGKIGSGKDTVGNIIQYLTARDVAVSFTEEMLAKKGIITGYLDTSWEIKKFADKLKEITCMLIGCTREQLEDQEFKKTVLGPEWNYLINKQTKGKITLPLRQPEKKEMTVREFLQKLGTEAMRNGLHENVWVNSLMCDYKIAHPIVGKTYSKLDMPRWIITDTRFPNELEAVKAKEGVTIKVSSPLRKGDKFKWKDFDGIITEEVVHSVAPNFKLSGGYCYYTEESNGTLYIQSKDVIQESHPSETALDDATFDYEIVNDGTIEDLVEKVRVILTELNII